MAGFIGQGFEIAEHLWIQARKSRVPG